MAVTPDPARAFGGPLIEGVLRQQYQDFIVEEVLGFCPEGDGEHLYMLIEKQGLTTPQVVQLLARWSGLPKRRISYAGLKDKYALTRQWFSLHSPGRELPDKDSLQEPGLRCLQAQRHRRKLQRGAHRGNQFRLCLRQCQGDRAALAQRIERLRREGFPNYFTEQRFGRGQANLYLAQQWFGGQLQPDRLQRGFCISASRAYLFNQILSRRVAEGSWDQLRESEIVMLNGSNSLFVATADAELQQRLRSGDIHLTGPLPGLLSEKALLPSQWQREWQYLQDQTLLLQGLVTHRVAAQRRALRAFPQDLQYGWQGDQLHLSFILGKGSYATALLRELANYRLPDKTGTVNQNNNGLNVVEEQH